MNTPLENGTLLECDTFSAIVVKEDLLLVYSSELPDYASEGSTLGLVGRGSNFWAVESHGRVGDFLINRDWNGVVTLDWGPSVWDEWYDDDDWDYYGYRDELHARVDAYDDYRSLSSPGRIPRADRAFACRHRSGDRRHR